MEFSTRDFIDANGRRLHAAQWTPTGQGTASPIVLLHDSLGAVALWRDFPEQLCRSTGRMVIAYDRPGFGKSAAHPGVPGLDFIREEAAASLLPLLDQAGISRAVLLGHSVGGGMAIAAAAQFPQRIAAVITESAQAMVEERTLDGIRLARARYADPAQLARLAKYHGDDPADLSRAAWVRDAWIDTWLAPGFAGWTLADDLRRLTCPVLAMHGAQDEFGSAAQPAMIAGLPSAFAGQGSRVMFEQCGHVPHREQPRLVLDAVVEFLQRRLEETHPG